MSVATLMDPVDRAPSIRIPRRSRVGVPAARGPRATDHARSEVGRFLEQRIEYVPGDWSQVAEAGQDVCQRPEPRRLSASEEAAIFRRMNYLKHQAERWRRAVADGGQSAGGAVANVERLWEESLRLRNYLVQVFSKLAVSVARPYVNPEFRLDELLSEAHVTLLRCVEIFDADRGYRFSTYATNAMRHNLNRYVSRQHKLRRATREYAATDDCQTASGESPRQREREYSRRISGVNRWMRKLDPRERTILQSRYGWNSEPNKVTLQSLAEQLGLSRERIRQLELRAIEKLRDMARSNTLDDEA